MYAEAQGQTPLSYEVWLATIKGEDGKDGVNGAEGKSAYEIWLALGNKGTEAEFIASLVGAKGEDGNKGATGEDGKSAYEIWLALGNEGTELDFIESLIGAKGDKGDPYVLTDADKTEIENDVSAEIEAELNTALDEIIAIQEELMTPDGDEVEY